MYYNVLQLLIMFLTSFTTFFCWHHALHTPTLTASS